MKTDGGFASPASVSLSSVVPFVRLSRMVRFFFVVPAPARDAFAGEMDNHVEALETLGIDAALVWVPLDLGRTR